MMPELDHQRREPPGPRPADESRQKRPDAGQHDHRVAVMEYLGVYEPRERLAENAARVVHRPLERVHLIRLHEMLGPVREDDHYEDLERALVPRTVQFFDQAFHDGERPGKGGKAKLSAGGKPSSAGGFYPSTRFLAGRRKLFPALQRTVKRDVPSILL